MSRSQPSKTPPKGRTREKPAQSSQRDSEPRIRSVLIEPRHNEPPRISVSVEYESSVPTLAQLKKAAMEVCHSVVRAQTFVDLGERQNVQRGELTKCFEVGEKGEGGG